MTRPESELTPREILAELDRFIVGQAEAKRMVAIALRNRWRRRQVVGPLADEITPKNILMIGPTGVGKTEIARRLAKLANAPFVKVEASKYTEVGYVGRDVEGMVRDLVTFSVNMVKAQEAEKVATKARNNAIEKVVDAVASQQDPIAPLSREAIKEQLAKGELDSKTIRIDVAETGVPVMNIFSSAGMEEVGLHFQDMLGNMMPRKTRTKQLSVKDALVVFEAEERERLLDPDKVNQEALERAQNNGIIFIDEMDKIAGRESAHGPDVSREGVQRDLLPIVEGTHVTTKYGVVSTEHILFIAAGAFHISKVSDLIPELQGRFPIRVELSALTKDDFVRILSEPDNSLVRQYEALMETEGVKLEFQQDGIETIAEIAADLNARHQNIGARRLHTVLEKVLEDLAFHAPDMPGNTVKLTANYVRERLGDILKDDDLSRYIL
ncbi:MAG TPA: ATP-dependent protease ATPase subunit HslU [Myxococcota bacterium]|nr:ATP-dependent protease ATPase subunit HslU [Myxococcota bacterium]HON25644.1 ATP-dependent protease ATPase subunit HslU [Myxococcota bacterium]HOS61396.1 ATP-dependent protease ATPase subunit HslU [Myxococcota bacterium]HPC92608.1 ATP-dependent protease ATPase subunit HslU [Myxococcota bacterium]HPL25817.1 ATP-dependent protease ATPase subunit HslU [Myxococcota bacterium]